MARKALTPSARMARMAAGPTARRRVFMPSTSPVKPFTTGRSFNGISTSLTCRSLKMEPARQMSLIEYAALHCTGPRRSNEPAKRSRLFDPMGSRFCHDVVIQYREIRRDRGAHPCDLFPAAYLDLVHALDRKSTRLNS